MTKALDNQLNAVLSDSYHAVLKELQAEHAKLLEIGDFSRTARDNPALIGDSLTNLRLHVARLYRPLNTLLDLKNAKMGVVASRRQELYEEALKQPKGTPSSAKSHSTEMTRVDEIEVAIIQNAIKQIENEISRYDGITMMLMARMKEYNTERAVG